MSLEEMKREVEQQKTQQLGVPGSPSSPTDAATDDDSTRPPASDELRRVSVHEHHPSVALLEKAENHLERRKQALMAHAGYQVDPKWWDSKLKIIKKAQQAHHKVVQSISMDHPLISLGPYGAAAAGSGGAGVGATTGLDELRYDSSEDEREDTLAGGDNKDNDSSVAGPFHRYNDSGTEVYKGDPITPRLKNDDSSANPNKQHAGLKITHFDPSILTENEREEFEQQRKQLEKVLKDFDLLLKNYENATANLEVLSKIAFDKQNKQSEMKDLDDKFTSQLQVQGDRIDKITNSVNSIVTSMNELKDVQANTLSNIESQIKETNNLQTKIIERETIVKSDSNDAASAAAASAAAQTAAQTVADAVSASTQSKMDVISNQQKQNSNELQNKLDQLITSMNQSFTQMTNQIKNMSQGLGKDLHSLSQELKDVASMQQELQQEQQKQGSKPMVSESSSQSSYKATAETEDLPLLSGPQELEPKQYVLKRMWCCGLVCFAHACGIGVDCC